MKKYFIIIFMFLICSTALKAQSVNVFGDWTTRKTFFGYFFAVTIDSSTITFVDSDIPKSRSAGAAKIKSIIFKNNYYYIISVKNVTDTIFMLNIFQKDSLYECINEVNLATIFKTFSSVDSIKTFIENDTLPKYFLSYYKKSEFDKFACLKKIDSITREDIITTLNYMALNNIPYSSYQKLNIPKELIREYWFIRKFSQDDLLAKFFIKLLYNPFEYGDGEVANSQLRTVVEKRYSNDREIQSLLYQALQFNPFEP